MDVFDYAKNMVVTENQFLYKASGEYETANRRTPYRLIALILNRFFGRANGKLYKISWIPIIYYVDMQGMIFNWVDIMTSSLSFCIAAAMGV